MNSNRVSRSELIAYLDNHDVKVDTAHNDPSTIRVLEEFTVNGGPLQTEWKLIPATFRDVRAFLNY